MRKHIINLCAVAAFLMAAAFIAPPQARASEGANMGRDLTRIYSRAADAERRADPELGGIAIRLLREDQTNGGLMQTAYSTGGFIVYTPREAQGEMIANARLYPTPTMSEQAIAEAERFDVITNAAGGFLRYKIKDSPTPTGATREFRMIVAQVDDPTPFHLQE